MNQDQRPLMVTIQCITYNHEKYIRQCLEGFVMQKTNFRFEAIVHDDASTDGTADIIREYAKKYPDVIKPILETENQYSKHDGTISKLIRQNTYGKYVAICEGDDCWNDPLKLQKQVDFLETHPEYGLVHSYFNYIDVNNKIIPPPTLFYEQLKGRIIDGYVWDYYLSNPGFILTCTCMYRNSLYNSNEHFFFDHGLFMMISRQSKVYCIREITASYRRNPMGAMCTASDYYLELHKKVIVYQLYYYFSGSPCNSYYKENKKIVRLAVNLYISMLLKIKFFEKEDQRVLLNIVKIKPSILLTIPIVIIKKVFKKVGNNI